MKKVITLVFLLLLIISTNYISFSQKCEVNSAFFFKTINTVTFKVKSDNFPQLMTINSNSDEKAFLLNNEVISYTFKQAYNQFKLNNFPISPNENATVNLTRNNSVFDQNTEWIYTDTKGNHSFKAPDVQTFSGKIDGYDSSEVFIAYIDNTLYGYVQKEASNRYIISPLMAETDEGILHILIEENNPKIYDVQHPFICGNEEAFGTKTENDIKKEIQNKPLSNTLLVAQIICEGEYKFYNLFKDSTKTASYIVAVMALANKLYEREINVHLNIKKIVIHTDSASCPYSSKDYKYLNLKLDHMVNVWKNDTTERALITLFACLSCQPSDSQIGGISYINGGGEGTLCSKVNGYAAFGMRATFTYPVMNYTWDGCCAAHEMGHSFGAPHTHSCYFSPNMIDTCVTYSQDSIGDACIKNGKHYPRLGTIMSYCHLTNGLYKVAYNFHEREIPLMRGFAEKSACLQAPINPTVYLTHPLGDSILVGGDIDTIRWRSANVDYISLAYSTNNGKDWNLIYQRIPASQGYYIWVVPSVVTDSALVLIFDTYKTSVSDTSYVPFKIQLRSLTLTNPVGGKKYSMYSQIDIAWSQVLVPSVKILFSSDAGANWSIIDSSFTGSYYTWDLPDNPSDKYIVKIVALSNSAVTSQSGLFGIGKPTANILTPQAGDTLCVNNSYIISWDYQYASSFWLEYSTNDGVDWNRVRALPIDATTGYYTWNVPYAISQNALLRVFDNNDRTTPIDVTKYTFYMLDCSVSVDNNSNNINNNSDLLKILEVIPNPIDKNFKIKYLYNLQNRNSVSIALIDERGAEYKILNTIPENSGENILDLKIPQLPQGSYILSLRSGDYLANFSIKIIR